MRKTIIVCDKCSKEIIEADPIMGYDFCCECKGRVKFVIDHWVNGNEALPENVKIVDEDEKTSGPTLMDILGEESKQALKEAAMERKEQIDWDKACALKIAGWKNKDIAAEIKTTLKTVDAMIYKKVEEYKNGKRQKPVTVVATE